MGRQSRSSCEQRRKSSWMWRQAVTRQVVKEILDDSGWKARGEKEQAESRVSGGEDEDRCGKRQHQYHSAKGSWGHTEVGLKCHTKGLDHLTGSFKERMHRWSAHKKEALAYSHADITLMKQR